MYEAGTQNRARSVRVGQVLVTLDDSRARELQKAAVETQQALDRATMLADSLKAKIALSKSQLAATEARIYEAQQSVA